MTVSQNWFKDRWKGKEDELENFLRDLRETEGAPKKKVEEVMNFLFNIKFLEEQE